jgi:multicomponent Na+:H+ antiporter subunit C
VTEPIIVGLLAGTGVFLVLQRGIARIVLGLVVLGHAAVVLLLLAGGVENRGIPFPGVEDAGDPLPQAFALTAIVISFGITAFLLTLAFRGRDTLGDDDVERDPEAGR